MKTCYFLISMMVIVLLDASCAKERPYLSGHVRRAHDAVMVSCDPYNQGELHTCAVISSAIKQALYVYDATLGEMVLSPIPYLPLKIAVGPATDELVAVSSNDPRFPFMIALDKAAQSIFSVRLFPSEDKKQLSFVSPERQVLTKSPDHAAAFEASGKIIVMMSFPKEGTVELHTMRKDTGAIDATVKPTVIKIGTAPSFIAIDSEQKAAVITDLKEQNLHVIDLATIDKVLANTDKPKISSINTFAKADSLLLARRDLGAGKNLYALTLHTGQREARLVDIHGENLVGIKTFTDFPTAAYFPDEKSASCCGGKQHWFSVATIQGNLIYVTIDMTAGQATLKDETPIDLLSESNLDLSTIQVKKIVGGTVHPNKDGKREDLCSSHRQVFYFSAYGSSRPVTRYSEAYEVEAHAYSCEGDRSVSRFGFKTK